MLEYYRNADADTKKAAVKLLKGETSEIQQLIGNVLGNVVSSALSGSPLGGKK